MTVYGDRTLKGSLMLNEVTRVDPTLVGLVSSQETRILMHNVNLVMSWGKRWPKREALGQTNIADTLAWD